MAPTKLSIETRKWIVRLIQEGNPQWSVIVPSQICLKFAENIKEKRQFKEETPLVDQERHQSVGIENLKQYAWK